MIQLKWILEGIRFIGKRVFDLKRCLIFNFCGHPIIENFLIYWFKQKDRIGISGKMVLKYQLY